MVTKTKEALCEFCRYGAAVSPNKLFVNNNHSLEMHALSTQCCNRWRTGLQILNLSTSIQNETDKNPTRACATLISRRSK